uniref:Formyl peptide receptor 1 n=1 Tax=Sander lucioperca TaxID=283035 RepID=A0A8C9Z423_SANLU
CQFDYFCYGFNFNRLKSFEKGTKSLYTMSLIICCLAIVLGVFGNGMVIWVTRFKMKKTVYTVWFLNFAVANFLFTASMPLRVTYFMCKLNSTLGFLNMFSSVYILVVISVDRCVSVVWPVWTRNHRSVRKASFVSLGLRQFRHQAMTITRFLLGFVVPFTVIVSCYAVIIHRLRRNRTLASQSSRSYKIIAAVITTFFLCWAPYQLMALIELVSLIPSYQSETLDYVTTIGFPITNILADINSCLNPLLYVFIGQDFKVKVRKSILKILETAFQEEVFGSHTDTKSVDTSRSTGKSALGTEV